MTPSTKVTTQGAAAAATIIGVWLIEYFTGVDLPLAVEGSATVLLSFTAGYLVPERNPSPSMIKAVNKRG